MSVIQKNRLKNRPKDIRTFICNECGARIDAPKYKGKTSTGHQKIMWCYRCKKKRKFTQIMRLEDLQCTETP